MKTFTLALACAAVGLSGCASSLKVWDSDKPIAGVPFRAAELYRMTGDYTRHSEQGANCTKAPFDKPVSLATGAQYYANVSPAQLAKTGFGMTFADGGTLASITLNTEPVAAETVTAVSDALTALLPFAGVSPAPAAAAAAAAADKATAEPIPACDTGPVGVDYKKFIPG